MRLPTILAPAILAAAVSAGSVPSGKPEDAGMSPERLRRIHESIQRHIDAGEICGAVTLVARQGRIVHFEAHGLMDLESKKPMERDTIFRLASMTKPVTGVAVLMLVEEGKVRLSDPVSKFIPSLKDPKVAVARHTGPPRPPGQPPAEAQYYLIPAEREITIRDLLTHTSGLGSAGLTSPEQAKLLQSRAKTDTLADFTARFGTIPLEFQPGSQWRYSGLMGIDALGRVVEVASGKSFAQFLEERLFGPLGMKDTSFYVAPDRRSRLVTLYRRSASGQLEKNPNQEALMSQTYFSGGGGLSSTAEDYLQFAQMLVNGGELNGRRYLSPRTVSLMASNHVGDMFNGQLGRPARGMGFGFTVAVIQDAVAAGLRLSNGSFGWDGAFGTQVWIDPKEKMVDVLMIQTQVGQVQRDFENAVMQAIVD